MMIPRTLFPKTVIRVPWPLRLAEQLRIDVSGYDVILVFDSCTNIEYGNAFVWTDGSWYLDYHSKPAHDECVNTIFEQTWLCVVDVSDSDNIDGARVLSIDTKDVCFMETPYTEFDLSTYGDFENSLRMLSHYSDK